jgi:hypothetical protein
MTDFVTGYYTPDNFSIPFLQEGVTETGLFNGNFGRCCGIWQADLIKVSGSNLDVYTPRVKDELMRTKHRLV